MSHYVKLFVRWIYAIFLSIDLLASALTFGAPLETISARLARKDNKYFQWFRRALDWFVLKIFQEPNHCALALEAYNARVKAAPSFSG